MDVTVDGGSPPPALLWRKNVALLVYLARSPKRGRTRDHLIALLWGDKPEKRARQSLSEALRVLRRATGKAALTTHGGQVRLAPDNVALDVDRLTALMAASDWGGAAALVAGEFLEGFAVPDASAFEDWLTAERLTWRGRSVEALLRYADDLLSFGHLGESLAAAQRALALDPTSEPAVRTVMRCQALAGRRAAALELYDTFVARLADQSGLSPDAATTALARRVRGERCWRMHGPERPEVDESRRAPLTGRERELGELLAVWAGAVGGRRPALALLEGDTGSGKSRLAEEMLARARLDGATTAAVRAVEADLREPWSGVLGLARGGLLPAPGVAASPPEAIAAFSRHIPEWADRFGATAHAATTTSLGRAFRDVLRAAGEEQAVVVVLDDAQWMDAESVLACTAALRDLSATPLLVVLALARFPARAEVDEARAHLGRELEGATIGLGPLPPAALKDLARWSLPSYTEEELDRVARRVAADSAGLPLLAIELFHAVSHGLDLRETAGPWPQPNRTLDQTLPGDLPDAAVAAIRVGYRRLSPPAQRTLAVCSVLGDRVAADLIARATGLAGEVLDAALDELEWNRWLTADPRGYAFLARIVREVIARDMLTRGQRQRILEAAGREWVESRKVEESKKPPAR